MSNLSKDRSATPHLQLKPLFDAEALHDGKQDSSYDINGWVDVVIGNTRQVHVERHFPKRSDAKEKLEKVAN